MKNLYFIRCIYLLYLGLKSVNFKHIFRIAFQAKELGSFTYELNTYNINILLHTLCTITGLKFEEIKDYYDELLENTRVKHSLLPYFERIGKPIEHNGRIMCYILIRALKSKRVVENGVEIGITSVLMIEAIRKNIEEGYPGEYIGIDINENSGVLLKEDKSTWKNFVYIDTIVALEKLVEIDFYFSDGCRYEKYEHLEFNSLKTKLTSNAIVISNKQSFSKSLSFLSIIKDKKYISFKEEPKNHWYSGTYFGILY